MSAINNPATIKIGNKTKAEISDYIFTLFASANNSENPANEDFIQYTINNLVVKYGNSGSSGFRTMLFSDTAFKVYTNSYSFGFSFVDGKLRVNNKEVALKEYVDSEIVDTKDYVDDEIEEAKGYVADNYYNKSTADGMFALIDETGNKIALEINSTNYQLVAKLYDKNNTLISTSNVIDLPLESIVTSATYYNSYTYEGVTYTKVIVITLSTTDVPTIIPVGDLVSGLQTEITAQNKLSSDLVDDTNKSHLFMTPTDRSVLRSLYSGNIRLSELESGTVQSSRFGYARQFINVQLPDDEGTDTYYLEWEGYSSDGDNVYWVYTNPNGKGFSARQRDDEDFVRIEAFINTTTIDRAKAYTDASFLSTTERQSIIDDIMEVFE
jgi:hypothetical protein